MLFPEQVTVQQVNYRSYTSPEQPDYLLVEYLVGLAQPAVELLGFNSTGFKKEMARLWWKDRLEGRLSPIPNSVQEALQLTTNLKKPTRIFIQRTEKNSIALGIAQFPGEFSLNYEPPEAFEARVVRQLSITKRLLSLVNPHIATLARKRKKLLRLDDYGKPIAAPWIEEIQNFLKHHVLPEFTESEQEIILSCQDSYLQLIEVNINNCYLPSSEGKVYRLPPGRP